MGCVTVELGEGSKFFPAPLCRLVVTVFVVLALAEAAEGVAFLDGGTVFPVWNIQQQNGMSN